MYSSSWKGPIYDNFTDLFRWHHCVVGASKMRLWTRSKVVIGHWTVCQFKVKTNVLASFWPAYKMMRMSFHPLLRQIGFSREIRIISTFGDTRSELFYFKNVLRHTGHQSVIHACPSGDRFSCSSRQTFFLEWYTFIKLNLIWYLIHWVKIMFMIIKQ